MGVLFDITPFGSLSFLEREQRRRYVQLLVALPTVVKNVVDDLKTGSFLRGLTKQYRLPTDQTWRLALAVLRVAVGEIELAKLGATLSAELKLPNDKAQAIAQEIEKELFAPVMRELNEFLEERKKAPPPTAGARNVVDLKNPNSQ